MTRFKYSAATLALLFASSMAYAQDSTTVQPQPDAGIKIECPAPGSVAEADLKPECKNKGTTSAETPKQDNTATSGTATTTEGVATPGMVNPATAVLASQFMGQTVYSAANENVGEINDLVMNKDLDNIVAIIGVGGFLGIGEKDVAILIDQITAAKDANNNLRLTIAATKEQLEAAPAFDRTALK